MTSQRLRAPAPPSLEQLAAGLGMEVPQLREMGERYRRYCCGINPLPAPRSSRMRSRLHRFGRHAADIAHRSTGGQ